MFGANVLNRRRNSPRAIRDKSNRVLEQNRDLLSERRRRAAHICSVTAGCPL